MKKETATCFESNHLLLVNSENKATNVDHRFKYKGFQNNIKRTSFIKCLAAQAGTESKSHYS